MPASSSRPRRRSTRCSWLRGESLESRQVLASSLGLEVPLDFAPAAEESLLDVVQEPRITQVALQVGDQTVTVTESNSVVEIVAGTEWSVVGVDFETATGATADDRFALEGYVRVQTGDQGGADFNYADGRFGAGLELAPGSTSGSHAGLDGSWTAELGQDRLAVTLVHYSPDVPNGAVLARYFVDLQVGYPEPTVDFVVDTAEVSHVRVGREATIVGTWLNTGSGTYQNYAEVDIYEASDLTTPVWVGTLAGVAGGGNGVTGEFLNTVAGDGFSQRWEPHHSGEYVIRFYADPENVWNESSEDNNIRELRIRVRGNSGSSEVYKLASITDEDDSNDKKDKKGKKDKDNDDDSSDYLLAIDLAFQV